MLTTGRGHRRLPPRPPAPGRRHRRPPGRWRRFRAHRGVQAVAAGLAALLCWVAFSVGQALTAPGNTGTTARLAEWARDHYLGPVVTFGEWIAYNPPKVGGNPQFSLTAPSAGTGNQPRAGTGTKPRAGTPANPVT